jgi:HEAT repeat protein
MRSTFPLILACFALGCGGEQGPSRQQLIAELAPSLNDRDPAVQVQTLLKLTEFGRDAQTTSPVLLDLLKSKNKNVRKHAALAVGRIVNPEDAVPALTDALSDPDVEVRRQAAMGLGELGPAAASALPALEKFANEPDRCATAANAIANIRK